MTETHGTCEHAPTNTAAVFSLLLDPPAAGAWNMAVDEALLEAAANEGQCTLRFYQWDEPTLSLGYFQAYGDRERHEPSRRSAVVRRSSGGGAIMHDFDLTYSLAVPEKHPLAVNRLRTYRAMHQAFINAIATWGGRAAMFGDPTPDVAPGETASKPFATERPSCHCGCGSTADGRADLDAEACDSAQREPFLCFKRRAIGDVLIEGEKIVGSAQRRCRGAVLQHGSVLFAQSEAAPELVGLKELLGRPILVEEFRQAWLEGISASLGLTWRPGSLSAGHRRRAEQLQAEKYSSPGWTMAR